LLISRSLPSNGSTCHNIVIIYLGNLDNFTEFEQFCMASPGQQCNHMNCVCFKPEANQRNGDSDRSLL
jgi:hypothetical protein